MRSREWPAWRVSDVFTGAWHMSTSCLISWRTITPRSSPKNISRRKRKMTSLQRFWLLMCIVNLIFVSTVSFYASTRLDWQASSSSFLACNSRLRSAIRRHHPPQRVVLSQICCFGERKMVMFQILFDGAEPCDAGTTQLSSPVCRRGGQQDPLGICVVVHVHNMPK